MLCWNAVTERILQHLKERSPTAAGSGWEIPRKPIVIHELRRISIDEPLFE